VLDLRTASCKGGRFFVGHLKSNVF